MKTLRYLPFFFLLALVGCVALGLTQPKLDTPQDAINEGNILVTAIANQAKNNFIAKTMSLDEKNKVVSEAKAYAMALDQAQAFLDAGNPLEAKNRAQIINTALVALQKRVAEKRTK